MDIFICVEKTGQTLVVSTHWWKQSVTTTLPQPCKIRSRRSRESRSIPMNTDPVEPTCGAARNEGHKVFSIRKLLRCHGMNLRTVSYPRPCATADLRLAYSSPLLRSKGFQHSNSFHFYQIPSVSTHQFHMAENTSKSVKKQSMVRLDLYVKRHPSLSSEEFHECVEKPSRSGGWAL